MTKAEMQADATEYQDMMIQAASAQARGLYQAAIARARAAWKNVDGMMQYEKKYVGSEVGRIRALDLVLKYAPFLLDYRSLDAAEEFLESCKRIVRTLGDEPAQGLAAARTQLRDNHRFWAHLEKAGEIRQSNLHDVLGGDQEQWRAVVHAWHAMGLISKEPEGASYKLSFATRLGQVVPAKCPQCGKISEAPKSMFFERMRCPECKTKVIFVLVGPTSTSKREN